MIYPVLFPAHEQPEFYGDNKFSEQTQDWTVGKKREANERTKMKIYEFFYLGSNPHARPAEVVNDDLNHPGQLFRYLEVFVVLVDLLLFSHFLSLPDV